MMIDRDALVEKVAMLLATNKWQFYHPAAQDYMRAKALKIINAVHVSKE